ncbi:DUF6225 family protein [Nonomuraea sp. NPDC050451]|uniref:DUF6225 family protein n=1 Tax=Nonomuraea sp. NPDC050451 TaxID=3364364 RepID=UPI0037B6B8CC
MPTRRAWTAGQLRAAIAHLPDDAPIVVHVDTDEDGVASDDRDPSGRHEKTQLAGQVGGS